MTLAKPKPKDRYLSLAWLQVAGPTVMSLWTVPAEQSSGLKHTWNFNPQHMGQLKLWCPRAEPAAAKAGTA